MTLKYSSMWPALELKILKGHKQCPLWRTFLTLQFLPSFKTAWNALCLSSNYESCYFLAATFRSDKRPLSVNRSVSLSARKMELAFSLGNGVLVLGIPYARCSLWLHIPAYCTAGFDQVIPGLLWHSFLWAGTASLTKNKAAEGTPI